MEQLRKVSTLVTLEMICKNPFTCPEDGTLVYCDETEKIYTITNKQFEEYTPAVTSESGLNMSLYDLNKAIVSQIKPLDDTLRSIAKMTITHWADLHKDNFYLLYGKEISYFTLFMKDQANPEVKNLAVGVFECLDNIGDICSVERTEDQSAIEIWVNTPEGATCLYLFCYGNGIVRIEE